MLWRGNLRVQSEEHNLSACTQQTNHMIVLCKPKKAHTQCKVLTVIIRKLRNIVHSYAVRSTYGGHEDSYEESFAV
jgi:hypothetical protein